MATSKQVERNTRQTAPGLFESKLHPPRVRSAIVPRTDLVDRLVFDDVPITSVVAPPGYGKTTLLAEWARREPTRVAWLSIDRHDNDLSQLLAYTAAALERVEPIDRVFKQPSRGPSVAAAASRVAGAMASMKEPVVLVFDHVEALENRECRDTIAELALHLPPGSRLALASRGDAPLPIARLRAEGAVFEIGVDELAMNRDDARSLLGAAGLELTDDQVDGLIARTEGWPVGLYFAALALKAGGGRELAGVAFSGDDRFMADYLRSEVLSQLSDDEVAFLTRTSVLDRMNGRLCDALLETTGSAATLETLAQTNLLVVPLDRNNEWYRYHHLFRDLLHSELERREPELVPALHLRAADWWEAEHLPELAVDHAREAHDDERRNRLVLIAGRAAWASGRHETLRRWLSGFEADGLLNRYPAVAVLGAVFFSQVGEPGASERYAAAAKNPDLDFHFADGSTPADRASPDRVLPDGSTFRAWSAVLGAFWGAEGAPAMRRDARTAIEGLPPGSGWAASALFVEAMSYLLEGDRDEADPMFARVVDVGSSINAIPAMVCALAERGWIAVGRGDWSGAQAFVEQAIAIGQPAGVDEYPTSAVLFALEAAVAMHRGDTQAARAALARAQRLRPLLTYVLPSVSVQTLLELARVYMALADTAGAREVLRQARDIMVRRPLLGVLNGECAALEAKLDAKRTGKVGASSLTPAELRLVPFLSTHLTLPQIAERLFVSRNTVKTQSIAIYQKLGVSSRSEAIDRLREIGLLAE